MESVTGNGKPSSIYASRHTSAGWSPPELIESDDTGQASRPQIAFDDNGNAIAVWQQRLTNGICADIWSNRYTAGAGWGTASIIDSNEACISLRPQLAVTPNGDAMVVWHDPLELWANRYMAGAGWGSAERIRNLATGSMGMPRVAINPDGIALVLWDESDGGPSNVMSMRYVPGAGWETPRAVENNAGEAKNAQFVMSANGNAVAVWQQSVNGISQIWANVYRAGGEWETPELIGGNSSDDATNPQIAFRAGSGAFAIWQEALGVTTYIRARRYTNGRWNTPNALALLPTEQGRDTFSPQIEMGPNGEAVAVWSQINTPNDLRTAVVVMAGQYKPDSGWTVK